MVGGQAWIMYHANVGITRRLCSLSREQIGRPRVPEAAKSATVQAALDAVRKAKSQHDLFRASSEFMQFACPLEVVELANHDELMPDIFRQWLSRFDKDMRKYDPVARRFEAHHKGFGVSFYSSGPRRRRLIVGFCGQVHLLGIPTPIILQYFPDELYDFIVLRDPRNSGFTSGIFGYADSFEGVLDRLGPISIWRRMRTSGASAWRGGGPIVASVLLNASVMVSWRPAAIGIGGVGKTPGAIRMEEVLRAAKTSARLSAVYSANNDRDPAKPRHWLG